MKAIDIIKGLCYGATNVEQCICITVPKFDSNHEFLQWQIHYFGFTVSIKQGTSYFVLWDNENFRTEIGEIAPEHEVIVEGSSVKFYEIEQ